MKIVRTGILAGFAFFLSVSTSFGADLDDIDFTIRVVGLDDVGEVHHELLLPDMIFDVAHGDAGHENQGQENDAGGHGNKTPHENVVAIRDERDDEIADHEDAREDSRDEVRENENDDDAHDEHPHHDEHHDVRHEEEHERER